jgi:hypothetical protein
VLLGVGAAAGIGMVMLLFVTLLNLTVHLEASVPPRSALPQLPDRLRIANEREGCGSGNCYREFDVVADREDTPDSILARLPATEECSAHSLIDWRPLCVGYRLQGNGVKGYVSMGEWLG